MKQLAIDWDDLTRAFDSSLGVRGCYGAGDTAVAARQLKRQTLRTTYGLCSLL